MSEAVDDLVRKGYRVVFFGVGPIFDRHLHSVAIRHRSLEGLDLAARPYVNRGQFELDRRMRQLVEESGGIYIDKLEYFCPRRKCRTSTLNGLNLVTFDRHHLTLEASVEFGRDLNRSHPHLLAGSRPRR